MEEAREEERRSDFISMTAFIVIGATVITLAAQYFLPLRYVLPLFGIVIYAIIFRYIGKYHIGGTGHERYETYGKTYVNTAQLMRLIALGVGFAIVYLIMKTIFEAVGWSWEAAFIVTSLLTIGFVTVVDHYAGRDMVEYLDHKESSHNRFVDSLTPETRRCQSCNHEIDVEDLVCSSCGFRQKTASVKSSNTSYTGQ